VFRVLHPRKLGEHLKTIEVWLQINPFRALISLENIDQGCLVTLFLTFDQDFIAENQLKLSS